MYSKKASHPGGPTTKTACVRPERDFEGDLTLLSPSDDRKQGLMLGDVGGDSSFVESLPNDLKLVSFTIAR